MDDAILHTCECGASVTRRGLAAHLRGNGHESDLRVIRLKKYGYFELSTRVAFIELLKSFKFDFEIVSQWRPGDRTRPGNWTDGSTWVSYSDVERLYNVAKLEKHTRLIVRLEMLCPEVIKKMDYNVPTLRATAFQRPTIAEGMQVVCAAIEAGDIPAEEGLKLQLEIERDEEDESEQE